MIAKMLGVQGSLVVCALLTSVNAAKCDETAALPSKAEIRAMQGASPTMQWAVERVAKELAAVYKIDATQNLEARTPFDDSRRDRAHQSRSTAALTTVEYSGTINPEV